MYYNLSYLLILFIFVSAIYTILSINPVHSILFLILTFINSSFLLMFLGMDFLGLSLIIIYVGAVAILFLFIVMLINFKELDSSENIIKFLPLGFLIFLNVYMNFFINFSALSNNKLALILNNWTIVSNKLIIEKIGIFLYAENFLSFILISFILLIAIVIVIYLANLKTKVKNQDLFNQIQF